jgi:murein DD-endopeptidase MepM/ murein hydrolase activator NlpD
MTLSRRFASAPVVLVLVLALVGGVAAPADAASSSASARKRQQQIKAERARKATQLNALKASDDQLEKAVAALATQVKSQTARVAAARQAAQVADAAVKQAEAKLATTEADISGLQGAVTNRAIDAYIRPQQTALAGFADAKNLEDASRRASLLRQVANNDRDVLDHLREAKQDLAVDRAKADAARSVASKRREAAKQQLTTLEQNLAEKAKMEHALNARIAAVTGEIDELAKEDATVTDIINRLSRADRAGGGGTVSGSGLRWPVSGPVTSGFGYRWGRLHAGIDIGAPSGTPIHAAKAGTVIFAGQQGGYGNVVIIDHGGGLSTLYAHQSRIGARDGEDVSGGDVIGYVGSTGHSTGPHLHFETRMSGSPQDPRRYL